MPGENSDLDFDIGSAMDEVGASMGLETRRETPEPSPAPAPSTGALSEGGTTGGVVDPQPAPAPTPAAQAPAPAQPTAPAPGPTLDLNRAPNSWKPEAAGAWATLPESIRAEIHRRESDFHNGISAYREAAQIGQEYQQVMAPYMQTLQQYGINPTEQVGNLMRAHYTLALGAPEEKLALFRQIAQDYQVDLGQLTGVAPFVDPAVEALQQRLQTIESAQQQQQRLAIQARQAEARRTVEAFFADPANKYAEECWQEMETLIRSGKSLQDAYKQAIWLNESVRAKVLAEQQQAAEAAKKAADAEAAKKAEAANKAALRIPARGVRPTADSGSLEATMQETLNKIRSRDN